MSECAAEAQDKRQGDRQVGAESSKVPSEDRRGESNVYIIIIMNMDLDIPHSLFYFPPLSRRQLRVES